jgi:hypothetical protein
MPPAMIHSRSLPVTVPTTSRTIEGSWGTATAAIPTLIEIIAFALEPDLSFIGLVPGAAVG